MSGTDARLAAAFEALADRLPEPERGPEAVLAEAPAPPGAGGRDAGQRGGRRRVPGAVIGWAAALLVVAGLVSAGVVGALGHGGRGTTAASGSASGAAALPAATPSPAPHHGSPKAASSAAAGAGATGTSAKSAAAAPAPRGPLSTGTGIGQGAMVVETGSVDLAYPKGHYESVTGRLSALATGAGGFVAAEQTSREQGQPTGSMTLRIPVTRFETVLHQVEALGRVRSETTSGQDLTGHYVDLKARIKALQATRSQLEQILAKATTVGDTLAVESHIGQVQSQIDELQGQAKLLANQAALSTLSISLSPAGSQAAPAAGGGLSRAAHDAASGFVGGFETVLSGSGTVAIALLCLAAGLLLILVVGRLGWTTLRRHLL